MREVKYDKNALEKLCEKHKLKLLILHGSYAKGQATGDSDIDVGILTKKKADMNAYSAILRDFSGIFGDKFDPAFLNNAEPMICYHAALTGKPLYENLKGAFADFRIQSVARYMDTKKFRELEKIYIKRAIGRN